MNIHDRAECSIACLCLEIQEQISQLLPFQYRDHGLAS
jgi:hypothetical protein